MAPPAAEGQAEGPSQLAVTLYELQARCRAYDRARAAERVTHAIVRGAAVGGTIRGGFSVARLLLGLLLARRGQGKRATQPAGGAGVGQQLAQSLEYTARWAAFLGSYAGVTVLVEELIACLGGRRRTHAWRGMAAGAAAGPTLLLTGDRYPSLSLYLVLRGLVLLVRCGNLPGTGPWKRAALAPTRWEHGDVALMCLSASQIMYSWICAPSTLPPFYTRFLERHGGKPLEHIAAMRELIARPAAGPGPLASLRGTRQAGLAAALPCDFMHPGRGCDAHALAFLPASYLRSLQIYVPVYLVPALLVHRQRLFLSPRAPLLWARMGGGVLRSSLFLSLYCALAWRGGCAGWRAAGRLRGDVLAASVAVSGLAALVEKKSRRMELAFYCLSRAIQSLGECFVEWGWAPHWVPLARLDVLLFSLASACILHCYSDHSGARRCVFRDKYLNGFDFVLGNYGFQTGAIRHIPSNSELLDALEGSPLVRPALALVRSRGAGAGAAGSQPPTPRQGTPVEDRPASRSSCASD